MPLVWLDNSQGFVMNTVNSILDDAWQNQNVLIDKTEKIFIMVLDSLYIYYTPGSPIRTGNGYRQMYDFLKIREGFCFKIYQFGLWFFQLKINAISAECFLLAPSNLLYGVIKLYYTHFLLQMLLRVLFLQ